MGVPKAIFEPHSAKKVRQLVWVQRSELPDLARRLVPRRWSGPRLQKTKKSVEPATTSLLRHRIVWKTLIRSGCFRLFLLSPVATGRRKTFQSVLFALKDDLSSYCSTARAVCTSSILSTPSGVTHVNTL